MKPVFVINGFLESGKTEFIKYTISQPYFQTEGTTLLIVCEEGVEEYEAELLKRTKTVMEVIEDEEEFTTAYLMELEKKYKPERIIIEFNGMWNYKDVKFPWHWSLSQQVTLIDASTFPMYYTNMKSLLAEMLRKSELIIFNRCDGIKELSTYKRNIKVINQNAQIVFEDANGEVNEMMEDELPYDLNKTSLDLNDMQYVIWYMDMMEHPERYFDKEITYVAQVMKPEKFPKGMFVPGRMTMTCCADDIAFLGYVCKYDGIESVPEKEWVKITVTVKVEHSDIYGSEGPVLYAKTMKTCKTPKQEVISFS